jgi:hypothetical protein
VSRPPLVLAIEPDLRQAAIVKRIVRERVQADVTVVDSRDAAIEAIRATMPDVLLVSALLSPRDEDDLIAHLRTLDGASHLQTHTIPQLASTLDSDGSGKGGLLSAFRRKKPSGAAPAGCDPDLFADEIREYLQRAAEKKRQAAERPLTTPIVKLGPRAQANAAPAVEKAPEPVVTSSWESPFEWRPTGSSRRVAPPPPEPPRVEPPVAEPPPPPSISYAELTADPEPEIAYSDVPIAEPEPMIAEPLPSIPEPVAAVVARVRKAPPPPRPHRPAPLSVWARKEGPRGDSEVISSELRRLLSSLSVPDSVASVTYADGCRIRRVRVPAARDAQTASGPVTLARRMLAELRGTDVRA